MLAFRAACLITILCIVGCKQQSQWEHSFLTEEGAQNVAAICVDDYLRHDDQQRFEQCMVKFGFIPKRSR